MQASPEGTRARMALSGLRLQRPQGCGRIGEHVPDCLRYESHLSASPRCDVSAPGAGSPDPASSSCPRHGACDGKPSLSLPLPTGRFTIRRWRNRAINPWGAQAPCSGHGQALGRNPEALARGVSYSISPVSPTLIEAFWLLCKSRSTDTVWGGYLFQL